MYYLEKCERKISLQNQKLQICDIYRCTPFVFITIFFLISSFSMISVQKEIVSFRIINYTSTIHSICILTSFQFQSYIHWTISSFHYYLGILVPEQISSYYFFPVPIKWSTTNFQNSPSNRAVWPWGYALVVAHNAKHRMTNTMAFILAIGWGFGHFWRFLYFPLKTASVSNSGGDVYTFKTLYFRDNSM